MSSSNDTSAEARTEKERSKALEATMAHDQAADRQINKLLLLGAGESGKSTLFKQMITIYGKGFSDQERMSYVPIIHNNILTSMKTLCKYSNTFGPVMPANQPLKHIVEVELKGEEEIDPKICDHISALWRDPGIQKTYSLRAKFQLNDSAAYFFDKIRDIA